MLKLNSLSGFGSGVASPPPLDGGYIPGASGASGTDKLTFSLGTTAVLTTANTSTSRTYVVSMSNVAGGSGWFVSGTTHTVIADKLVYSTEVTTATTTADLTTGTQQASGTSDGSSAGYHSGGTTSGGTRITTTEKLTYSTEQSAVVAGAALSTARNVAQSVSDSSGGAGYIMGGTTGAHQVITDKLTFATDTTAAEAGANLTVGKMGGGASSDPDGDHGYISGGNIADVATELADRIVFSTDTTAAQTSADLSSAREGVGGVSDSPGDTGWFVGGWAATTDRLVFSTDTTAAATTADLPSSKANFGGGNCLSTTTAG